MSINKQALDFNKPTKVGKYEIQEELGRGACGIVYKGYDPFVQRQVAVKIARYADNQNPEKTKQDQRDFFVEAHAAGKLDHPQIVSLFDAGVEEGLAYIVMEFIEGDTLLEYCRPSGKRLTPVKAIEIMFRCAKALAYSHSQGVLHRDIKPSNIMLTVTGDARIMDFSIAEVTQTLAFKPDQVMGSPAYMSPEQVRKETVGPQSDLYSLGAVMYQLLVGEPPFISKDVQQVFRDILKVDPPRADTKDGSIPKEIADIIEKCLKKSPKERYQTGQELAAALARIHDKLRHTETQLSRREHQNALKGLSFFSSFPDDEIDEILNASNIMAYQKGAEIIKEGDIDQTFYIIAKGEAEVRKAGKKIETLRTGDCFGEIGFLLATKRTASVYAASDMMLLKVSATLMEEVSQSCQLRYYKAFTETLIYRLSLTSARLSSYV